MTTANILKEQFSFAKINKSGPHTTTQDLGRSKHQHTGFSSGGAADEHAFRWANKLVDNPQNSSAIEIIFGPFEIVFFQPCLIAITGAQSRATINNIAVNLWQTQKVSAGDRLKLTSPQYGLINYLAIAGGFISTPFLGSSSIVVREKTGPNNGLALVDNSLICYRVMESSTYQSDSDLHTVTLPAIPTTTLHRHSAVHINRTIHPNSIPDYSSVLDIHLFLNSQCSLFDNKIVTTLFSQEFSVDPNSNKMGYKLHGTAITLAFQHHTQTSEGIGYGAVQIPPDGQPIILLKDRQTIGGYPKIGAISQLDAFKLSQRRAGQTIRFIKGDITKQRHQLKRFLKFFNS